MVSLSDITKATAGGESYIWLQSGWYKNRPLFIFSLALCALSCSLPPLSDLFLPVSPFFSGSLLEDLSSFYPYFFSTTSTSLFSLLSSFKRCTLFPGSQSLYTLQVKTIRRKYLRHSSTRLSPSVSSSHYTNVYTHTTFLHSCKNSNAQLSLLAYTSLEIQLLNIV